MSDCPTKEQIDIEVDQARAKVNFHAPEIRALEEYLAWYRLQLSIRSLAIADPIARAQALGKGAMMTELVLLGQEQRKEVTDGR